MEQLNRELFLYVNANAGINHNLDLIVIAIAYCTPYLFLLIMIYSWFKDKKHETLYAGYATSLGLIINSIIGMLYHHNRPFVDGLGVNILSHNVTNSFPSNHTTFLISIAIIYFLFSATKTMGRVLLVLAVLCAFSRIYCGVHYPFDIAGSMIVAILSSFIIYSLKAKLIFLNEKLIGIYNLLLKKDKI